MFVGNLSPACTPVVPPALQSLQDRVAPFPEEAARREVEQALGKSILEVFAEFEAHPMAAASIAQVHRARLRDGRPVVVKIRRPTGEEAIIGPKNFRTTRRVYRETAGQVEP